MPAYDYMCDICKEESTLYHSISDCDRDRICFNCNGRPMTRLISSPHIEGSSLYPFELWNIRTPDGRESMTINNKAHHKKVLADKGFTAPFFSVGG